MSNEGTHELRIKRFCFPVTFRCNLRCKLCAERAPYYQQPYHPSLSELTSQIDRLFSVADGVDMFDITGGEPLLRKDLPHFIQHLHRRYIGRIGKLRLTTNGTMVPGGELLDALMEWRDRVYVIVDRYAVSTKADSAAETLAAAAIPHEVRDYTEDLHCCGWVDYGDFTHRHSVEEAQALFDACAVPRLNFFLCLVDGRLFPCSRARLLYEQGIAQDCFDLSGAARAEDRENGTSPGEGTFHETAMEREALREGLRAFLSTTFLKSCMYCDGLCENSPRFLPAEQL